MLYGTVAYKRKNNSENEVDWAARAHLIRGEDGVIKMDFYQVYLVCCVTRPVMCFRRARLT